MMKRGSMSRLLKWIGGLLLILVVAAALIQFAAETIRRFGAEEPTSTSSEPTFTTVGEFEAVTIPLSLPDEAKPLEMVFIPAGTFRMGSPEDEEGRRHDWEWLPHEVTIGKGFFIGRFEVTQAQWEAVMGEPLPESKWIERGPNYPAARISWNQCQHFVEELNRMGVGSFRLPTEAEWEYACRAGTRTTYSFEDSSLSGDYMWWGWNEGPAAEVGLKLPNPWGLYDMHGNVGEWCSDLWEAPYPRGTTEDPRGPEPYWLSAANFIPWYSNHVYRGAVCHGRGRSATRCYEQAFDYHYRLGLRLVRD
jgi:formylglycine-generating enzyme required for sulfatase activity